ncbi:MAG: type II toxin-antitoxin system RelE/ParE family toxin [Actinomycetota bacterium]
MGEPIKFDFWWHPKAIDELLALDPAARAQLAQRIDLLERAEAPPGKQPEKIEHSDLWAIKTQVNKVQPRAYCGKRGRTLAVLTVFIKKGQKAPKKDIDRAAKRLGDWPADDG